MICGLKLTHDGGVAVIADDRLLFSVEAEKLDGRPRHSSFADLRELPNVLATNGVDIRDVTAFAVDGWMQGHDGTAGARVTGPDGEEKLLPVAGYSHVAAGPGDCDRGEPLEGLALPVGDLPAYRSYAHATGHAFAGYCTSPFAGTTDADIVVWDGGMPAWLYTYHPDGCRLESHGPLFEVSGALYPIFASRLAPFAAAWTRPERSQLGNFSQLEALLPVSGKAMAYAGLGDVCHDAVKIMDEITAAAVPIGTTRAFAWSHQVLARLKPLELSDASILASFQEHLRRILLESLTRASMSIPGVGSRPLCLSGGCALNIKWNSSIRSSGLFPAVWVPPFPNDSGSAIGVACAEMARRTRGSHLDWDVFSGPMAARGAIPAGWRPRPCTVEELGRHLASDGRPVAVIDGRAELGPRALGHRSIIAPATDPAMQAELNRVKRREPYRPVAPICLVDRAAAVFDPGTADPYMLFDHRVRPEWLGRIPAVVHVDGTARLQTVGPDNDLAYRLLTSYDRQTGIPVLCNTSANGPGQGFFPDAGAAMAWGEVAYVWHDGALYARSGADPGG